MLNCFSELYIKCSSLHVWIRKIFSSFFLFPNLLPPNSCYNFNVIAFFKISLFSLTITLIWTPLNKVKASVRVPESSLVKDIFMQTIAGVCIVVMHFSPIVQVAGYRKQGGGLFSRTETGWSFSQCNLLHMLPFIVGRILELNYCQFYSFYNNPHIDM